MEITYRDSHDVDLNQLATLRATNGFAHRSRDELAAQVGGARWVVSAWDGPRLIGFARAISDGVSNAYVSSVMVDSAYRRRGIGRAVMSRLMANRGDDIRWVLHARVDAKAFYAALGFTAATDILWCGRNA